MPVLPLTPGGVRIQLKGKMVTGNWANVMYIETTGTNPNTADLTTFATDLATLWGTTLGTLVSSSTSLTEVVCTAIHSYSGDAGVWAGTAKQGTVVGAAAVL